MITGIEHTGIMVSNMEKSLSFYTDILGLELIDRFDHTSVDVNLAFLGLNGKVLVELIAGYPGEVTNEGKVHHQLSLSETLMKSLNYSRKKEFL